VVGPPDLVETVMSVAAAEPVADGCTLIPMSYGREQDAVDLVAAAQERVEAFCFTGPVPYDLTDTAGVLHRPASVIPLAGEALYRALLQVAVRPGADVHRISVDTLAVSQVREAYLELGLDAAQVRIRPYTAGDGARQAVEFHLDRYGAKDTCAALTCRRSVYDELLGHEVPAFRIVPTRHSIRAALMTAALLASGSRAEHSRLALCVVEVDQVDPVGRATPSTHWMQELRLNLHRVLLGQAQQLHATLVPLTPDRYLLVTTFGDLEAATDGFRAAPLLDEVDEQLGLRVSVGIGAGRSAHDAEQAAYQALAQARSRGGHRAMVLGEDDILLALPRPDSALRLLDAQERAASDGETDADGRKESARRTLEKLRGALGDAPGHAVVDAAQAADLLSVSPRTARRLLQALMDQRLAWPVASEAGPTRGRPRRRFRLADPP
jgi:hypothetical protein